MMINMRLSFHDLYLMINADNHFHLILKSSTNGHKIDGYLILE